MGQAGWEEEKHFKCKQLYIYKCKCVCVYIHLPKKSQIKDPKKIKGDLEADELEK